MVAWHASAYLSPACSPRLMVTPRNGSSAPCSFITLQILPRHECRPSLWVGRQSRRDAAVCLTLRPLVPAQANFFTATGHNVTGKFLDYWQQHGGLNSFGYPITEQFTERNSANGRDYTVQYFERARFEWHPEAAGTPFEVQLGLLGMELLRAQGGPGAFTNLPMPAFYPSTAQSIQAASPGTYPKFGAASDYSWVAGRVTGSTPCRPEWPGPSMDLSSSREQAPSWLRPFLMPRLQFCPMA